MDHNLPPPWRVWLKTSEMAAEALALAIENFVDSLVWAAEPGFDVGDDAVWDVEGFAEDYPDRIGMEMALALTAAALGVECPVLHIERLENRDWLKESLRSFPPIVAGRFFVHGSHFEGEVPPGSFPLLIDAGLAFGSGEHNSTKGCLLALSFLANKITPRKVLDMGCGSAILGLGMGFLWPSCKIIASDIDYVAVNVALVNASLNKKAKNFRAVVSDGYKNPVIPKNGPYDVIAANILARPLTKMAKDLSRNLAPGGYAILAGLLGSQENMVRIAHHMNGLRLVRAIRLDNWSTLVLQKA